MLSLLYFISEISSLYVFVGEGGLIKVLSSWHNHLPKCAKLHFSEPQILKISGGRGAGPPQREGASSLPYPPPPHARGACKALSPYYITVTATPFHSPSTIKFGENHVHLRQVK